MKINYHSNRKTTFDKLKEGDTFKIDEEYDDYDHSVYFTFYDETMNKCRAIDMDTFKAVDIENDYVVNPIEIEINVYGVDRDEDEDE